MELLNIDCLGRQLRLEGSIAGWQQLYWDHTLVAQRSASHQQTDIQQHRFELQQGERRIECVLEFKLNWQPFTIEYELRVDNQVVSSGSRNTRDIEQQVPHLKPHTKSKISIVGLGSLGLKLFKSAKAIKVLFAGASLAAYSWLFSIEFALALIACLVIHEYGHIRAMKYFNMPTKGIYLIPFVGGLALSDSKINTRWQDVVISIMGPTFGLLLSIASLLLYFITDEVFFAALASFNALLNLFNLLPILPLDGGHILKSISFSFNSRAGIILCSVAAVGGVYLCWLFNLTLFALLLAIGSVEIVLEWRSRHRTHLLPLDRYGQLFSSVWYIATVAMLIGVIALAAKSEDPILKLPLLILNS